jgi:hypothetical protein
MKSTHNQNYTYTARALTFPKALIASAFVFTGLISTSAQAFDGWHVQESVAIPGKNSSWDYISLDDKSNRLYLGRRATGLPPALMVLR